MHTRDEILAFLDQVDRQGSAFWNAFPEEEFFAKIGEAWSPAENVRHLAKSIRPVAKALRMPKIVVRLMFGGPRNPSMTYDGVVERYRGALARGGDAGRFAPSQRAITDRAEIMGQLAHANGELRDAIGRWPDCALDRHQLPHPLMGKMTVREMLFFTVYHQLHHLENVKRRKQ
jgi:hypothetical protein